jgi:hypothetical protein
MIRFMLVVLLVACAPKATTPSNTAADPSASAPAPAPEPGSIVGPGGKHVATERVYEGKCAPPGSRGGCITITLRPDGTYKNFLYDAAIEGTYSISDHTLTLEGPAASEHMTFSPDYEKLDELALKR